MIDFFIFALKIIAKFFRFCYNNKNAISCIVTLEMIPLTTKLYDMVMDLIFTKNLDYTKKQEAKNLDYTKKQEAPCFKCPYGQYCYGTCVVPDDMKSNIAKGSVKTINCSTNNLVYDLT